MVILNLMLGGFGCGQKKEAPSKPQTAASQPLPEEAFKALISLENKSVALKPNTSAVLKIKVRNMSPSLWPSRGQADGKYGINLSYHWIDQNGKIIVFDGLRTALPHDLMPNEEVTLNVVVATQPQRGEFFIEFDLVQELVAWFKDKGSQTLKVPVKME